MIVRSKDGSGEKSTPVARREKQKLTEEQIKELAKTCIFIENHYKITIDIEWAIEKKKFYIIQCRPITAL